MIKRPFLGFGLGLRTDHFQHVLENQPSIDWFEVISENFMVAGGKPKYYVHAIREHYPMVMHGVSLSIGSSEPLDKDYLRRLKLLVNEVEPEWVSDHLCWTSHGGINTHDLLPLPYTDEAIRWVAGRVQQVQDYLGRQILLENVSSYLSYTDSAGMTEWEFYNAVCKEADCLQLFDVNNVYVSARNHGFDPKHYIDAIDPTRIWQIHLAGHSDYGDHVIDTHDHPVCDDVWLLYRYALERFGAVSTMIERDDNIPSFEALCSELRHAKELFTDCLGRPVTSLNEKV